MNHHPDTGQYIHAARTVDQRAQARAWKLRHATAGADSSGRDDMPVRARLC